MRENGELDYRPKKETPLPRLQNVLGIVVHTQDAESGGSLEAQGQANLIHTAVPDQPGLDGKTMPQTKQNNTENRLQYLFEID